MKLILALIAVLLAAPGCSTTSNRVPATIHHAVFIVLNNPADAPEPIGESRELGNIPGVTAWAVGGPVDTGRATVDAGYDVGLYVGFPSAADYQVYVDHPIHTRLVTKWRPRWKSILIRDFGGP